MSGATASASTAVPGSTVPAATISTPVAHNSTHTCETRIAPYRSMNIPDARLAAIEPA